MCSIECAPPTLETQRLRLRPLRETDAPAIATHAADLDIARMSSRMPHPYSLDEAKTFLDGVKACEAPTFAIADNNDTLIGTLGFHNIDEWGAPEIGYWLAKPYWGHGLATEAVSRALKWASEDWGRKVVRAGHFADNPASGAVLIKSDFLYTGEIKDQPSLARGEVTPTRMMVWLA
jgi:RimJ/RimL family protein N-acetyltransferase